MNTRSDLQPVRSSQNASVIHVIHYLRKMGGVENRDFSGYDIILDMFSSLNASKITMGSLAFF